MATEAQINANRQNAQASTGPISEAGKAIARLNAVKTGLTCRIMLLSEEDTPIYNKHIERFFTKYAPANDPEHDLVQKIADDEWRLRQVAPLEAGIYARGRLLLAYTVINIEDPVLREGALRTEIYLAYRKELAAIQLQERRLNNQVEKATAKLVQMQKERTTARQTEVTQAEKSLEACKANNFKPDFPLFGFDFSPEELTSYLETAPKFFALSGGKTLEFDRYLTQYRASAQAKAA